VQEADQDNQNAAIRSSPESRKISANIASGLQQIPRVSPGYEAGAVGKSRKDRKDTERSIEYRKKPKMAAAPPKINLRKAYED
jgi:hypothetical protein